MKNSKNEVELDFLEADLRSLTKGDGRGDRETLRSDPRVGCQQERPEKRRGKRRDASKEC